MYACCFSVVGQLKSICVGVYAVELISSNQLKEVPCILVSHKKHKITT